MTALHILLVEDEPDYVKLLQKVLTKAGYRVSHADNLQDALGIYYATRPDLVILDIFLDGKPDGIVFAQKINENQATSCPFLFLTSSMDQEIFRKAKLTSPFSYLLKPFNPLELHYAIELALEKFADSTGLSSPSNLIATTDCLFVRKGDLIQKVPKTTIHYLAVDGRYTEVHLAEEKHVIQAPLKDMLVNLEPAVFLRVHRNFAVNFEQIDSISPKDGLVILSSGTEIPLSRRYMESIKKNFSILF